MLKGSLGMLFMCAQPVPGLIVLHGNQMELLRDTVMAWIRDNPLGPLDTEYFLVQSNGVADWLKGSFARHDGIYAAAQTQLPAQFMWEVYRAILGDDQVPVTSAFDKDDLTWRLMRLWPTLLQDPVYAPLHHYLADQDALKRLQLSRLMADLYDKYQVYRAPWLQDWSAGMDQLQRPGKEPCPLTANHLWQAHLWRAIMGSQRSGPGVTRFRVHQRFLQAVASESPPVHRLPQRVTVFGISSLPYQTLEGLAALANHAQVILAVPNPCQYYWGDIMDGKELLKAEKRRQRLRNDRAPAPMELEDMHAFSHPLLASWGRQGRDFIRLLDEFDRTQEMQQRFPSLRMDVYAEAPAATLLEQVQAAIRDLLPLAEHPHSPPEADDQSISFHQAHHAMREVEVLHDQLLQWLDHNEGGALTPKDIIVMVPDIDAMAPLIHAVFGQYSLTDARFIPYEVIDTQDRGHHPILRALELLLHLPESRCRQSDIRDLLDVPALAQRFAMDTSSLSRLAVWMQGAGVRWGLDEAHRQGLGLGASGEQNSWLFGLRRMLLGYACGHAPAYHGIEPYPEVGGLDAAMVGSLADLVEALIQARALLATPATPEQWGVRIRQLLQTFFVGSQDNDQITLQRLDSGLQRWLEVCEQTGFGEPVPLAVVRESWLGAYDEPSINHRFISGGVTFCSLMPMRSLPYRRVCLLGMNDGAFPRPTSKLDFDLLDMPGLAQLGDRSRRDDDRYLMLEALLAAREKLYISWTGYHGSDNRELAPSVLVAQLRDYLVAGWDLDLSERTFSYPLQPFSRRYFEAGHRHKTYAREWRAAHEGHVLNEDVLPDFIPEPGFRLTLEALSRFVRRPVQAFFRTRLKVSFFEEEGVGDDEEPLDRDPLQDYQWYATLFEAVHQARDQQVQQALTEQADKLSLAGDLPIGALGKIRQETLIEQLSLPCQAWRALCALYPESAQKVQFDRVVRGLCLQDWMDRALRQDATGKLVWLDWSASNLHEHMLIPAWIRHVALAAHGYSALGYVVGRDKTVRLNPLVPQQAIETLQTLLSLWLEGMQRPLPVACKTALAWLREEDASIVYEGGYKRRGECQDDAALARLWPDFAALRLDPDWERFSKALYQPLVDWVREGTQIIEHPNIVMGN